MKKILLLVFCVFASEIVTAQQIPQFSQNMFNKLYNNPGFAGSKQAICATTMHRSQWMGFDGAPTQLNLSIDAAVPMLNGGIGLNVIEDNIAQFSNLGIQAIYAYRTDLGDGQLGIGTSLGMMQMGSDGEFNPQDANDDAIPPADKASALNVGLGLYYNTQDVYIGLSSNHLTEPTIEYADASNQISTFKLERHYFLIAGYYHALNPTLSMNPSIYLKSDGATSQLDINTNLIYNNKLWGGVSYRLDEGLVVLTGMNINEDLKFGIAYDVVMNNIGKNSLEFMLGYCFKIKYDAPVSKYKNPRFL